MSGKSNRQNPFYRQFSTAFSGWNIACFKQTYRSVRRYTTQRSACSSCITSHTTSKYEVVSLSDSPVFITQPTRTSPDAEHVDNYHFLNKHYWVALDLSFHVCNEQHRDKGALPQAHKRG